jgi:hypothetical protein
VCIVCVLRVLSQDPWNLGRAILGTKYKVYLESHWQDESDWFYRRILTPPIT